MSYLDQNTTQSAYTEGREFDVLLSELERETLEMEFLSLDADANQGRSGKNLLSGTTYFLAENYLTKDEDRWYLCKKAAPDKLCLAIPPVSEFTPRVAVYIPPFFNPAKPVDFLFFFHGFLVTHPGMKTVKGKAVSPSSRELLNYYSSKNKDFFNLRKVIDDRCKNIILVVPTLGPRGQAGILVQEGTWKKFRESLLARIRQDIFEPGGIKSFEQGKTIFAGHSGAGKVMRQIVKFDMPNEVWGLDSHYGGGEEWQTLATKFQATKFYFYHHPDTDKSKNTAAGILSKAAETSKNIFFFKSKESHFDMVLPKMNERLQALDSALDKACVDENFRRNMRLPEYYRPHHPGHGKFRRLPPMYESALEEIFFETGLTHETPGGQSVPIPAQDPTALNGDAFPKQMLYLNIPIGFGKGSRVKRETAVFFPSSFNPKKPVDLLVYFHGYLSAYPGNNTSIRDYLNYKDCGTNCINLREEIERSGKNIILIAPTLDNKGQSGTLTQWGKLDQFLEQVKAGIAEHFLKPKFGTGAMKKGRLILSGHSGGGARLAELARHIGSAEDKHKKALALKEVAAKLKAKGSPSAKAEKKADDALAAAQIKYRADEFWGFDSTYGSASTWLNTARRFPQIRLFMYYNPDGHKSKTPTFELMARTKSKSKPGVLDSLVLINVKDDPERRGHFKIIRPSLRERFAGLTEKGDGTEWESELQYDALTDLKKKLKKARYVQWIQYALGQALGKRIETDGKLANVKKPLEEFRKLKGLTGTGDFDVEAETALIALRVHHPDVFLNSCVHSVVGKKDKSAPVLAQIAATAEAEYARWGNGTIKESDPAIQSVLKAYWSETVNNTYGYTHKKAWSAVFVSWVIQKAGAGNFFPTDDAHSVYTFYSKLNRARPGTYYRAYRSFEVKPSVGDVIVRARDGSGASYDKLGPDVIFTHGQIVVEVQADKLFAIGGNEAVKGGKAGVTVNRREVKLGADGYLPCDSKYFTVIRLDTIDRTWIHIPRIGSVPSMPEYESGDVTRGETADRILQMLLSRLGKCPVNPNDMVSLVSSTYARTLFGPGGKLHGELQNEADVASRSSIAFPGGLSDSVKRLLNKLELNFIHDPAASTLDLLPAEMATEYKTFKWDHDDYPGNKNKVTKKAGKNQGKAGTMHRNLILIRPERRPNSTENKVMSPQQFCKNKKYIMGLCGNSKTLMSYASQSFTNLQQAAKADGVTISVDNDFRYSTCKGGTVIRTTSNPNSKAVGTFSSHMMGLAIDLNLSYGNVKFAEVTTRPFKQVIDMRTSPTHKWMFLKGALHGWYPLMPEPWHWEYNPPGFRDLFWKDLEAAKPKKKPREAKPNRKPRQKEFEYSVLDELMNELDWEDFKAADADKLFLVGKVSKKILKKYFVRVHSNYLDKATAARAKKRKEPVLMLKEAYGKFKSMFKKAKKDIGVELRIVSAFRSFDYQKDSIWEPKWNGTREVTVGGKTMMLPASFTPEQKAKAILEESAMPGTSRHHWGTDIDIVSTTSSYFEQPDGQKIYTWLLANAGTFGFCQPYNMKSLAFYAVPLGLALGRVKGYNQEKWHWSYKPISKPLLAKYTSEVGLSDISGFAGDQTAAQLDVIEEFVRPIAFVCQ